jgi:hypothetical protein
MLRTSSPRVAAAASAVHLQAVITPSAPRVALRTVSRTVALPLRALAAARPARAAAAAATASAGAAAPPPPRAPARALLLAAAAALCLFARANLTVPAVALPECPVDLLIWVHTCDSPHKVDKRERDREQRAEAAADPVEAGPRDGERGEPRGLRLCGRHRRDDAQQRGRVAELLVPVVVVVVRPASQRVVIHPQANAAH